MFEPVWPALDHLVSYRAAPRHREAAAREGLARLATDPAGFIPLLVDCDARGDLITMPAVRQVPRRPQCRRRVLDVELCGSTNVGRPARAHAPAQVPGHICDPALERSCWCEGTVLDALGET